MRDPSYIDLPLAGPALHRSRSRNTRAPVVYSKRFASSPHSRIDRKPPSISRTSAPPITADDPTSEISISPAPSGATSTAPLIIIPPSSNRAGSPRSRLSLPGTSTGVIPPVASPYSAHVPLSPRRAGSLGGAVGGGGGGFNGLPLSPPSMRGRGRALALHERLTSGGSLVSAVSGGGGGGGALQSRVPHRATTLPVRLEISSVRGVDSDVESPADSPSKQLLRAAAAAVAAGGSNGGGGGAEFPGLAMMRSHSSRAKVWPSPTAGGAAGPFSGPMAVVTTSGGGGGGGGPASPGALPLGSSPGSVQSASGVAAVATAARSSYSGFGFGGGGGAGGGVAGVSRRNFFSFGSGRMGRPASATGASAAANAATNAAAGAAARGTSTGSPATPSVPEQAAVSKLLLMERAGSFGAAVDDSGLPPQLPQTASAPPPQTSAAGGPTSAPVIHVVPPLPPMPPSRSSSPSPLGVDSRWRPIPTARQVSRSGRAPYNGGGRVSGSGMHGQRGVADGGQRGVADGRIDDWEVVEAARARGIVGGMAEGVVESLAAAAAVVAAEPAPPTTVRQVRQGRPACASQPGYILLRGSEAGGGDGGGGGGSVNLTSPGGMGSDGDGGGDAAPADLDDELLLSRQQSQRVDGQSRAPFPLESLPYIKPAAWQRRPGSAGSVCSSASATAAAGGGGGGGAPAEVSPFRGSGMQGYSPVAGGTGASGGAAAFFRRAMSGHTTWEFTPDGVEQGDSVTSGAAASPVVLAHAPGSHTDGLTPDTSITSNMDTHLNTATARTLLLQTSPVLRSLTQRRMSPLSPRSNLSRPPPRFSHAGISIPCPPLALTEVLATGLSAAGGLGPGSPLGPVNSSSNLAPRVSLGGTVSGRRRTADDPPAALATERTADFVIDDVAIECRELSGPCLVFRTQWWAAVQPGSTGGSGEDGQPHEQQVAWVGLEAMPSEGALAAFLQGSRWQEFSRTAEFVQFAAEWKERLPVCLGQD